MPPEYVLSLLPLEVLGAVGVVAAALWGVRMLAKMSAKVRPWLEWLDRFRDGWDGTPEVRDASGAIVRHAVKGVPAQLDEHAEAIAEIRYNVKANHGKSAHDDLTRKLDANTDRLDSLIESNEADRAKLLEANKEIREQLVEMGRDLRRLQRQYSRDLRANHPHYSPPDD